jgi:hypothetical protein
VSYAVSGRYDLAALNLYGYNTRNELTSGRRYFGTNPQQTNSPVAGQAWVYGYDGQQPECDAARGVFS